MSLAPNLKRAEILDGAFSFISADPMRRRRSAPAWRSPGATGGKRARQHASGVRMLRSEQQNGRRPRPARGDASGGASELLRLRPFVRASACNL